MGLDEAICETRLNVGSFDFKEWCFKINLHGFYIVLLSVLKKVFFVENGGCKMRKLIMIDFVQIEVSDHSVLRKHYSI